MLRLTDTISKTKMHGGTNKVEPRWSRERAAFLEFSTHFWIFLQDPNLRTRIDMYKYCQREYEGSDILEVAWHASRHHCVCCVEAVILNDRSHGED